MAFKSNYVNGVVICHGKSELKMSRFISSNLHLNIKTFARDGGKHSIQITSLDSVLRAKPFNKLSSFLEEYTVETSGKAKDRKLVNFKLFIIMDTDDCTDRQREDYQSKAMFKGHWLYDYIVPVVNIPTLEDVLVESGMMHKKIRDDEKGAYYTKIFPINSKPLSNDTLTEVQTLRQFIEKSKHTNLNDFIDYCLSLLPQDFKV